MYGTDAQMESARGRWDRGWHYARVQQLVTLDWDRADISSSQHSGDHHAAVGNVLGSALTCQLRQPEGSSYLDIVGGPPPSCAQRLEVWNISASKLPSQQAKLVNFAAQFLVNLGVLAMVTDVWVVSLLCKRFT